MDDVWECYFACVGSARANDRMGIDSAMTEMAARSSLSDADFIRKLYVIALSYATIQIRENLSSDDEAAALTRIIHPQVLKICPIEYVELADMIVAMRVGDVRPIRCAKDRASSRSSSVPEAIAIARMSSRRSHR